MQFLMRRLLLALGFTVISATTSAVDQQQLLPDGVQPAFILARGDGCPAQWRAQREGENLLLLRLDRATCAAGSRYTQLLDLGQICVSSNCAGPVRQLSTRSVSIGACDPERDFRACLQLSVALSSNSSAPTYFRDRRALAKWFRSEDFGDSGDLQETLLHELMNDQAFFTAISDRAVPLSNSDERSVSIQRFQAPAADFARAQLPQSQTYFYRAEAGVLTRIDDGILYEYRESTPDGRLVLAVGQARPGLPKMTDPLLESGRFQIVSDEIAADYFDVERCEPARTGSSSRSCELRVDGRYPGSVRCPDGRTCELVLATPERVVRLDLPASHFGYSAWFGAVQTGADADCCHPFATPIAVREF